MNSPDSFALEWKMIPGWPEYEISDRGDVRRVAAGRGARAGRILKCWINSKTGYYQIHLWRGNRAHPIAVHRLVALAFLGDQPSESHLVAHSDGSRTNNNRSNLRWATQRENMADTLLHGTHNRGERNGHAKIDSICVVAIRRMTAMGIPRAVAAEGFGLVRQTVDDIVNGRRWKHTQGQVGGDL